jgi:DNA-binding transcriptional MerR regulator
VTGPEMGTAEVAAMFGVHRKTVWQWKRDGLLHPVRRGWYARAEVEALRDRWELDR